MIPDYQKLMRPVLEHASYGEVRIGDIINRITDELGLTDDERRILLPSGKQSVIANRIHWAKSYLKQAGLVIATRRGHFKITVRGKQALANPNAVIDNAYLNQFNEFKEFRSRSLPVADEAATVVADDEPTPDERLRQAHGLISDALASDLLDRLRSATPSFFETAIVDLLIAMGYGGTSDDAGRAIGRSGDDGVDGVIDQDPLGVDQIYIQAKRYKVDNLVGAGAIRDFFGSLSLKRASKGIFVTTSSFSTQATQTATSLGSRIVLIDGPQLARLMIRYNVGCRVEETLHLKKIDEEFFERDKA